MYVDSVVQLGFKVTVNDAKKRNTEKLQEWNIKGKLVASQILV